jgi:hypothetical protein
MLQNFNTFNAVGLTAKTSVGGDIPIWQNPEDLQKVQGGFSLANAPSAPAVVPGGTPIDYDEAARTAGICYRFEVYETAAGSPTTYKIVKDNTKYGNLVKVGMNLMIMPAAVGTAGAAYPVLTLDTSNADYDVITVGTSLGDVTAGDILAEADSTHATTAKLLYVAEGLTYADVYVQSDDLQHTCAVVYFGSVYDRRIRKIDAIEKAEMPQINFSQSK